MIPFFKKQVSTNDNGVWWQEAFEPIERALIEEAYKPLGNGTAEELVCSDSPPQIGNLLGHLKKEHLREYGYKLIARADGLISDDQSTLDSHFYWNQRGDYFYRWRELDDFALDNAIESYQRQIAISAKAIKEFEKEDWGFLPAHGGYRQLRIIEEKRGNLGAARKLCEQAKSQGWSDDWDKHLARIDKKIRKRSK